MKTARATELYGHGTAAHDRLKITTPETSLSSVAVFVVRDFFFPSAFIGDNDPCDETLRDRKLKHRRRRRRRRGKTLGPERPGRSAGVFVVGTVVRKRASCA